MRLLYRVCIGALILPSAVIAHHGIGNFNHNLDVDLTGIITDVALINPHSWLYLDVANEDGNTYVTNNYYSDDYYHDLCPYRGDAWFWMD